MSSVAATQPSAATDPPPIAGLEAGIIPQRAFPLRKWYYANQLWYYHQPSLVHQLRRDPKFYELVDPELRELCHLLLQAGLCTTPSCQGHLYPRERFAAIWEQLRKEQEAIVADGLPVKDCETDALYLFRDPDYRLPWADFDAFYAEADAHQIQGYIGIAVPRTHAQLIARLTSDAYVTPVSRIDPDPELTRLLGESIFNVHVTAPTPEVRSAAWAAVTAYIAHVLRDLHLAMTLARHEVQPAEAVDNPNAIAGMTAEDTTPAADGLERP